MSGDPRAKIPEHAIVNCEDALAYKLDECRQLREMLARLVQLQGGFVVLPPEGYDRRNWDVKITTLSDMCREVRVLGFTMES